ncbi:MAG: hypothetical protein J1E78_00265 [Muribaculaceae bacterium]|nr:hypothetical protein [Muribaculaceae bacterium]
MKFPAIKNISLFLACILLTFATSCKKESGADLSGLLRTIPSSAAGVVGIQLQKIIEDAGCTVKGNEIIPGKEVSSLLDKTSSSDQETARLIFNGSTGIKPDCAVIFIDGTRTFLTFFLYDVNKFIEAVEKDTSGSFSDEGSGVKVCENIALKGNQAWICLSNGKSIDPEAIAGYASLSESRSFLKSDLAETILNAKNDISGWCMLNEMLQNSLSRSEMSMATIASGLLFDDAESVQFSIDFKDGDMEMSGRILNDKGKPSKFLLPTEKVDLKVLQSIGGDCDMLLAFTLTPKLIDKFEKLGSVLGGSLFGDFKDTFKNIDGTVGVALSNLNGDPKINGVISTKGKASDELIGLITTGLAPVKVDGNQLRFSNGTSTGNASVADLSEMLKGCWFGVAFDMSGDINPITGKQIPDSMKSASVRLFPRDGSLELIFNLKSNQPKQNILLTLLNSI